MVFRFYPRRPAYWLQPHSIARLIYPSPSLLVSTNYTWCRNINLLSIDYGFRPRLRTRLTLGGLTCPRNPWDFGEHGFSPVLSLLMLAFSLVIAPVPLIDIPSRNDNAPLPL